MGKMKNFSWEASREGTFWRSRHRWEDNIKMDVVNGA
jgi:hypothetical protein